MAIPKLQHPYLSGEHDKHRQVTNPGWKKQEYYVKHKMTPREYVQMRAGSFGHNYYDLDDLFQNHPHNNESNNSKALELLRDHLKEAADRPKTGLGNTNKGDVDDYTVGGLTKDLMKDPLPKGDLHHIIDNPTAYGLQSENLSDSLKDQPNLDKEHLMKLAADNDKSVGGLIKHPKFDKDAADLLLNNPNKVRKLDSSQIGHMVDSMKDERPEKQLLDQSKLEQLIHNTSGKQVGEHTLDKMINAIEPDKDLMGQPDHSKKKDIMDSLLGIEGGEHHQDADQFHLDDPDDADRFHYQNWSPGPKYDSKKSEMLAGGKHLTPDQIDHIKRHGDTDEKYELFKNPNIDPKHATEMYNNWINDDQNKGYDLDELKQKIKDENKFSDHYDNYYEQARENAQENYPFSEFLRDNVDDSDLMDDKSEDEWIENHLAENNDWEHDTGKKDEDGDPIIEDYSSSYDMDKHPEYQARREEAQAAYDKELERAKANPPDDLYDRYDQSLQEDESNEARKLYDDEMDSAHENPDFLPKHLPQMEELHRMRHEQAELEARKKAAAEDKANQEHLNAQVPQRTNTHPYGDTQHQVELAKQYADANGGVIDIGHLNKMHPNMKDKWKAIFGPKGKLTSQELDQKWQDIPKTPYAISHRTWTGMQNINERPQTVFRLDHTPESLAPLKADENVYNTFAKIADISQRSGHPTNANTIAWSRVDTNDPKHWMIDEVQSDFGSAARDYLDENGKKEEADSVNKIIDYHKNWREALINHVINMAKANGVETVSTHSPESKAAHTGADKVHTVYKDSYGKVPRSMGFMPVTSDRLPLTDEGKSTFITRKSGTPTEDLIRQHKDAMGKHAEQWQAHGELLNNSTDGDFKDAHEQLEMHHSKKYKEHQGKLAQLDPTDVTGRAPIGKMASTVTRTQEGNNEAVNNASQMVRNHSSPPIYGFDSALNQKPQMIEGHPGHQLNLNSAAMKKSMDEVEDLLKADKINNDVKQKIAATMHLLEENQEVLEQLKTAKPEAYAAIHSLVQTMIDMAKKSAQIDPHALMHEKQIKDELEAQQPQQEQQPEQPGQPEQPSGSGAGHLATVDQPVHGKQMVYAPGSERQYSPQDMKIKDQEGNWNSFKGGLQDAAEGQNGQ